MKFKFKGTIAEFIDSINTNIHKLNNDDLDVFNNETKIQVNISENICKVLLEKDNPINTEYWYISTIVEDGNHVIIDGKIKDCLKTKKRKILSVLVYIFFWPIVIIGWLLNEYTPFNAIKYRRNRLKKLMIKYTGCEEVLE